MGQGVISTTKISSTQPSKTETLTLTREVEWGIVSLFSMGDRAEHITLEGLQYPLTDGTIDCGFPLGVSNHRCADGAHYTWGADRCSSAGSYQN